MEGREKKCKEGKVVNPLTGRCIKKENLDKYKKKYNSKKETNMKDEIIKNLKILQEYENLHKEPYKAKAYKNVIDLLELFDKPITKIEDLEDVKGIGKKIGDKIFEYINTGKMHAVENALQDPKYDLSRKLMSIYGIGPVKIQELLKKINSFEELKERPELLNEKQKIGLKYYDDMQLRIPIKEGRLHLKLIKKTLQTFDKNVIFEMVGSFRRKNKDMGDIDILIMNKDDIDLRKIIEKLQSLGYIIEALAVGKNKFMGFCRLSPELPARRIDILIADPSYYYFALLYFTGSYMHNIYMRKIALQKGLSLSEYGFRDNKTKKIIDTSKIINAEEDIFKYLEIPYVAPDKRL
jgi:DNA polymerase beta